MKWNKVRDKLQLFKMPQLMEIVEESGALVSSALAPIFCVDEDFRVVLWNK